MITKTHPIRNINSSMETDMTRTHFHSDPRPRAVAAIVRGMRLAIVVSAVVAAITVGIVGYWRAEAADREQVNRGVIGPSGPTGRPPSLAFPVIAPVAAMQ
jgi:hypothetical protein